MMLLEKIAESERSRPESDHLTSNIPPIMSSSSDKTAAGRNRPKSKNWDHHLSVESLARNKSTLKATSTSVGPNGTISLGVARPHSQYYPWEAIDIHGLTTNVRADGVYIEPATLASCAKGGGAFNLAMALNYGQSAGSPQLLRFITEHVVQIHDPPYVDWECSLTCGTTSALEMVFRMLCNRGDWILAEEFTYAGAIEATKPLRLNVVGVEMDSNGLKPHKLDSILKDWDLANGPKPRVLYTVPTGQNPTGITQPPSRRRDVYQVAERHDLMIIEDDPYYLLPLVNYPSETTEFMSSDRFLQALPPSYLSLDASGRVIRLDTASKILAPGIRIGWITACSQLIDKFLNHSEFSTTSPSGPSQVMMYKLLVETWGHPGFLDWLSYLSSEYSRRLQKMIKACSTHLRGDICRWNVPNFGMFVWIEIDWSKHPSLRPNCDGQAGEKSWAQIEDRIYEQARQDGVQLSKGSWFAVEQPSQPRVNLRLTFAAVAEDEDLEEAIIRFSRVIEREFGPRAPVGKQT